MSALPIMALAFGGATFAMLAAWLDSRRRLGARHHDTRLWLGATATFALAAALPLVTYIAI